MELIVTLEEFEVWFEDYHEYFISRGILHRLNDPDDSFWAFRGVIRQQIRDVTLQEDQDFLILKYSEYF